MTESSDDRSGKPKSRKSSGEAATEGSAAGVAPVRHRRMKRRTRRILVTLSVVVGVLLVLGAAAGWVGSRALTAKSELEKAQTLVGTLKTQGAAMDFAGLGTTSTKLTAATSKAVDQTHDPLWRAAEIVPVAGPNLAAVRQMAESVDAVAQHALAPVASIASTLSPASLKPVDGKVDLKPLIDLNTALGQASTTLTGEAKSVSKINLDGTIGQVDSAGVKLSTMLTSAATMVSDVHSITAVAPAMLGASGPRTYLLMFQNLAETTALGGTSAALTEVTVNDGAIAIGRQASSQSFKTDDTSPVLAVDPTLASLYTPLIYTRLNLATSRPDFPTAALITDAFWKRDIGGAPVDGIISIDPAALAHILGATGPIAMSTGDQLSSENAVSLLLNEIYFRYQGEDGPNQTDAFFGEAAKSIFGALMGSGADPKELLKSVMQGVDEHRIMAWSSHPEEQAILADSALSGILPTTNEKSTTTGVYFRDTSTSKMDYYLETAAKLTTDVCTSKTPTFTATVDLHSKITKAEAAELPSYVASGYWKGKQFRTQVFVYGPPGTTLASTVVNVAGVSTGLVGTTDDLGRPVAMFEAVLAPGESSTVTVAFSGAAGTYAAPELRTTPMLNPTVVTVDAAGCAPKK
ncbi:hypothetical protein RCH16_002296 [Cryobacterium sp. MP_M5]|uniref:DUF4012 domain-containing protein n=1 Tax=unclassified Cryobacterium TaxID=2649013 RepID=UPI0018C913F5|nr:MULTISPECIES: DUF4012 domain-containing protein [unclassified Cryobacterium]MBG6058647.1 hypothetical protein [Cryobacterium sp. MP_M3]MEC5177285.1 hypothetical protein [Cryobacterium sp. MP_M5]